MICESPNRLRTFVSICGGCALFGLLAAWITQAGAILKVANDPTIPQASNFYHYTLFRFEPVALYASVAFFLALYFILPRIAVGTNAMAGAFSWRKLPMLLAIGVLVATCIARFAVYQNFDLCIDEYLNDFEVGILNQHHLVATVPEEWRDYQSALKVPYENYNANTGCWTSGFLPGFASLDFLFSKLDLNWALSPTLAAFSILLLGSVARRVFPDQPVLAGNVAILLMAFSPQFLAMAMTKFAWTAQLCGTLLWLWFLVQPNRILFLLTPVLGALLIGLHQPHVHPLVAAPFVLRLLIDRRWKDFLWFLFCYLIGAWAWYQVFSLLRPAAFASGGDLNNFAHASFSVLPVLVSLIFATFHAITLFAWTTPVLVPFLGIFLLTWKSQPPVVRDGFLAACLTFLFYLSFPHPQGHGWGFRYLHSAYGLLALASAGGVLAFCREGWGELASNAVIASVIFSVVIQVPYRIYEIRTMVRPLALTWNYISHQPTDFVIIKTSDFWYSWDLIRNDPWLQKKPLVFNDERLTPEQREELSRKGTVTVIGADQVRDFGVILSDPAKK